MENLLNQRLLARAFFLEIQMNFCHDFVFFIAANTVSATVSEIILKNSDFTNRMAKLTLTKMVQRDVSSFAFILLLLLMKCRRKSEGLV